MMNSTNDGSRTFGASQGMLCAGFLLVAGCATISLGDPQITKTPTGETTRESVPTKLYVAKIWQDGGTATISLARACETVEKRILTVRTARERHNDWAVVDWAMLGGGVPLGAFGAATIVDANDVYSNQKDQRTYNTVGQTNARLAGVGIAALGAALIAIPTVDAIRASSSSVTESTEPEPSGRIVARNVACPQAPAKGLAVVAKGSKGEPVRLGTIDVPGNLKIDLVASISQDSLLNESSANLLVDTQKIGTLDLAAPRAVLDDKEWLGSQTADCEHPTVLTACDGVSSYLRLFPEGRHANAANELLSAARPVILELKDQSDWKAAWPGSCKEPKDEQGCEGVQAYLKEHETGLHAGEARDVLKGSAKTIARLRAKAEAEAKAAERKAAAQADADARAAARGDCPGGRFRVIDKGTMATKCDYDNDPTGLVRDLRTGLTWLRIPRAASFGSNRATAADFCKQRNMRLPTKDEAVKLLQGGRDSCAFPCDWYEIWTSTPGPGRTGWTVHSNGMPEPKSTNWGVYQACVR